MKINFYSPVHFEPWNWENSITTGIGGSETSVVEMSWRLARQGHDVTVYAPLPEGSPNRWRDTNWLPLEACTFSEPGLWILYRCPEDIDRFIPKRQDQVAWLLLQDWDHPPHMWSKERLARVERIICLCNAHKQWLGNRHPEFMDKIWVTRNGIKADLIERTEAESHSEKWITEQQAKGVAFTTAHANQPLIRNPKRIMYASSPDRGMLAALKIFRRAKEYVPDLELHLTYGFDNLSKSHAMGSKFFLKGKEECLKLIEETGATMHGRVSQDELYRMWFQTGICLYCTSFWETGYITGLEASAMGAIPVFSPIWAQGENLKYGFMVQGDPNDTITTARFADVVRGLALDPGAQERIRQPMMAWARRTWDWQVFVSQWIEAAQADLARETFYIPPELIKG